MTSSFSKSFRPFFIFFLFLLVWSWLVIDSLTPQLPNGSSPPKFYSNQCRQDIRSTLLSAIEKTAHSIHLVMFGLSDRPILNALSKKIGQQVATLIYYDQGASPNLFRTLEGGELYSIKNRGLMHQKILILDEKTVFIGSANMTTASLRMHDNLVVGFVSKEVAKFLLDHKPFSPGHLKTEVGGQKIEIWLLPDSSGVAFQELKKKIRFAKRSIQMALFTFTHKELVDGLIDAKERGVDVKVVIDLHSGLGASSEVVEKLKKRGIETFLSQGMQLLHHKFAYIDEETLITGSANWTKAAFHKNSDLLLTLYELNQDQKKFMNHLWNSIKANSK